MLNYSIKIFLNLHQNVSLAHVQIFHQHVCRIARLLSFSFFLFKITEILTS